VAHFTRPEGYTWPFHSPTRADTLAVSLAARVDNGAGIRESAARAAVWDTDAPDPPPSAADAVRERADYLRALRIGAVFRIDVAGRVLSTAPRFALGGVD
jgi:hypothetical protein